MAELGGEMIVKPLDGKGGEGIFHLTADDKNLNSILEQSTEFGTRAIMAQEYVPEIREGDKRILLLEGEPIGAVLRVPTEAVLNDCVKNVRAIVELGRHTEQISAFTRIRNLEY